MIPFRVVFELGELMEPMGGLNQSTYRDHVEKWEKVDDESDNQTL